MSVEDQIAREVDERFFELSRETIKMDEISDAMFEVMRQKENKLRIQAVSDVARRRHMEITEPGPFICFATKPRGSDAASPG